MSASKRITVRKLAPADEARYDGFLLQSEQTLLYGSNRYRKLLADFLEAQDHYLIALDEDDEIVGALPGFIKRNARYGSVFNSLPFYGSNGGILEHRQEDSSSALLSALEDLVRELGCSAMTIISSPFDGSPTYYDDHFTFTCRDSRVGQMTRLPAASSDLDGALFQTIQRKTRTMVRKGMKSGFRVESGFSESALDGLAAIHAGNMRALGGLAKPRRFFRLIAHHFEYEKDFKLYTAYDRETPVSSLLLFYFNKTVEVFAIATLAEYRSRQPSSLLTFQGMRDAALRGMAWWNWGGTWASQKGVYHFKKHWGAEDFPYYYYTRILDAKLRDLSKETLLEQYPYFFVLPFGELSHAHF